MARNILQKAVLWLGIFALRCLWRGIFCDGPFCGREYFALHARAFFVFAFVVLKQGPKNICCIMAQYLWPGSENFFEEENGASKRNMTGNADGCYFFSFLALTCVVPTYTHRQ